MASPTSVAAAAAQEEEDMYCHHHLLDTYDDIRNELRFQQAIIASLRDNLNSGGPPENQRKIHRAEDAIALLRQRLNKMEQQAPSRQEKPSGSTSFAGRDGRAGPSSLSVRAGGSTSGTFTADDASQAKRPRPSTFGGDYSNSHQNKSHKSTSGSPSTGASTAADDSLMPFFDMNAFVSLTDRNSREMVSSQQAAFARHEQQMEDERIARALSEQWARRSPTPGPSPTALRNGEPSAGPSSARPPHVQHRMPGAYGFVNDDPDDEDYEGNDFILDTGRYLAGRAESTPSAVNRPALPLPTHLHNASAAERARQAALSRQQRFSHSRGPGSPAGPSTVLPSLLPHRPGMLNSGTYLPTHSLSARGAPNTAFNPARGDAPGSTPATAIDLTDNTESDGGLVAKDEPRGGRENLYDWSRDNQGQVDQDQDDPDRMSDEIRDLLANIRPDEDIPVKDRIGTPEALKYPLYPHQQLALKWMMDSEDGTNKGGILADDMGLGKTISTLALMLSRRSSARFQTNLIIGPVALIKQWEIEIKKKVKPQHQLKVFLYHNRAATSEKLRTYDVVLTSYGKLSAQDKRFGMWEDEYPDRDAAADEELAKSCPLVHPKTKFHRVILDEAQCIKSPFTYQSAGAARVKATHRWCLTGTPMMNGVHELWPLLRFLHIAPYSLQQPFIYKFGCLSPKSDRARANVTEAEKNKALRNLRILLKSIMLRRMKTSTLDGKPLLTLPPKTEVVVHVAFDEDERKFYAALEAKSKNTFDKYVRAGTVGKNYSNVLVMLLRLRQACCHQQLNLDVDYVGTFESSREEMKKLAGTLGPEVVKRLKATNEEGFECPICLDAALEPTIVLPCGHSSCGECFATFVGAAAEQNLRAGEDRKNLKCPECRGQIQTNKVINLAAFKAVHMPEPESDSESDSESDYETASEAGSDDASGSAPAAGSSNERNGDLGDFIAKDDEGDMQISGVKESDGDMVVPGPSSTTAGEINNEKKSKGKRRDVKGKAKQEKVEPYMLKTLRMEAKKNQAAYNRYMKYLKRHWMPSTKVNKCCEILESIQESGDKTIVFSQFTFLLDLLEIPIKHHLGINYCRYDGSMSRTKRDAAIQDFQDPTSDTKVMLVSLKAGNSGLNLTTANHVIIMDPFFNYFVENQAIDRAYRIGQRKPVKVYRILVKDTVEDRIIKIQDHKRQIVDAALDEGESKQLGRMALEDLHYLFNWQD